MQTKRVLATVIGVGLLALLVSSARSADMANPPLLIQPPPQDTNCYTASTTTNCIEGSITLVGLSVIPAEGCVGQARSATWSVVPSNGVVVITTTCTNAQGVSCTNCPGPQTNEYVPGVLSYSWTVAGVDATPSSGNSDYISFVPNAAGTGVFTLTATWQKICTNDTTTSTASADFTVRCPNPSGDCLGTYCGPDRSGGAFRYCFDCALGWEYKEDVEMAMDTCSTGDIQVNGRVLPLSNACWDDEVTMLAAPGAILQNCGATICTNQRTQIISIRPIGSTNWPCIYTNTQTMVITMTSASPPRGTVQTSSGGASGSCTW
jgi:hypothetical protein